MASTVRTCWQSRLCLPTCTCLRHANSVSAEIFDDRSICSNMNGLRTDPGNAVLCATTCGWYTARIFPDKVIATAPPERRAMARSIAVCNVCAEASDDTTNPYTHKHCTARVEDQ